MKSTDRRCGRLWTDVETEQPLSSGDLSRTWAEDPAPHLKTDRISPKMKPTTIGPLPDGAVAVRQGDDNQVTLSAEEVARLVAVATGHTTTSVARTPAKARLALSNHATPANSRRNSSARL